MATVRLYDKNLSYTEFTSSEANFQSLLRRAKITKDMRNRDQPELAPWTIKYSATVTCPICGTESTIGDL